MNEIDDRQNTGSTSASDGPLGVTYIEPTELPYLTACPLGGRKIVPLPYHDGTKFHAFVGQANGLFLVLNPVGMATGYYFSNAPAYDEDTIADLYTMVVQHYSFPKVLDVAQQMNADIVNALTSLHRYFVILEYANRFHDTATTHIVTTELEYAFANHRAFYDLLNKFLGLFRTVPQYRASQLPESLRRTLQKSDDELVVRFGIPPTVLSMVRSRQQRFLLLRSIRDGIFHRGERVADIVFHFHDGFAVNAESDLWARLGELSIWSPALIRNNGLASLLPLLALMASDLLETAKLIAWAVLDATAAPDVIARGQIVYFRSPLCRHVNNLQRYEQEHWLTPEHGLDLRRRVEATDT